jgi:hypothetical protein
LMVGSATGQQPEDMLERERQAEEALLCSELATTVRQQQQPGRAIRAGCRPPSPVVVPLFNQCLLVSMVCGGPAMTRAWVAADAQEAHIAEQKQTLALLRSEGETRTGVCHYIRDPHRRGR